MYKLTKEETKRVETLKKYITLNIKDMNKEGKHIHSEKYTISLESIKTHADTIERILHKNWNDNINN